MKKILLFVLITLTTVFVSNAQETYSITSVQIKDPNSGSWSELMDYSKLNLTRKYCISNNVGKYEISLLEGESNKAYFKLYNGSGALQKTMQGNWVLRDEGVYGTAYKLTISWTGPNAGMADLKFNCQYDGAGLLKALVDPQGRTWNSCN
jgi:hypothetical protein